MEFITTRRNEADKAAWLEKRKHYITGTDAGKLIGVSPWGGKFSVWLDKTGRGGEIVETEAMKWGKRNEGTILKAYAEETDSKVEWMDGYDLRTNDSFPRIGASLDGWNHTLGIPVDAKNIRWKDEKWGDAYTSEFPEYYKAQLQVQMMVTCAKFAHLAVLFCGQEFVIYTMDYDEEMAGKILAESDAFWPYVEGDEMPEADGSEGATSFVKETLAVGKPDTEKAATDEIMEAVRNLVNAKKAKKAAEEEEAKWSNVVKVFLGDSTVIPGVCTWKNNKDSVSTDWESVAKEAMQGMPAEQKAELLRKATVIKPGNRPLKITMKGF